MKFIKGLVVVVNIVILSSCANFSATQDTQLNVTTQVDETANLSPIQKQALALQTQPNLYKSQAEKKSSGLSSRTLKQFEQALLLKGQGELSQAKEGFMAIAQRSPELSGVWLQLALISKAQSSEDASTAEINLTDIVRYLNNAISANTHNYYAHNELAQVLRQKGQFQQALTHYQSALKSWPAFAEAYLNRGILYDLYLGKKDLALQDYQLYQALSEQSSRQVNGWIIDLKRQVGKAQSSPQDQGVSL